MTKLRYPEEILSDRVETLEATLRYLAVLLAHEPPYTEAAKSLIVRALEKK